MPDLPSLAQIAAESKAPIRGFQGTFRFLSNFWPINNQGLTVEHQYQASKCLNLPDAQRILAAPTPGQAKRIGRTVALIPDWNRQKVSVMRSFLRQKFERDTTLAEALLATGDAHIEETNAWGDTFWGVSNGQGLNRLGKLLIARRKELRDEESRTL